jgi:hypothetical protein
LRKNWWFFEKKSEKWWVFETLTPNVVVFCNFLGRDMSGLRPDPSWPAKKMAVFG